MDLATVALVVSITNGLAALTVTLIKLNDRRRIRTRSRTTDTSSVPDDAGASDPSRALAAEGSAEVSVSVRGANSD